MNGMGRGNQASDNVKIAQQWLHKVTSQKSPNKNTVGEPQADIYCLQKLMLKSISKYSKRFLATEPNSS